jgi:hypothetical protein
MIRLWIGHINIFTVNTHNTFTSSQVHQDGAQLHQESLHP